MAAGVFLAARSFTAPFCSPSTNALKVKQMCPGNLVQRPTVPSSRQFYPRRAALVVAVLANEKPVVEFDKSTAVEFHSVTEDADSSSELPLQFVSVDHVGSLCENLERSLEFYVEVLGLTLNPARPSSLPYRGAWLWVGSQMIHLMELENPDPVDGRPVYGGRDRHVCLVVKDLEQIARRLEKKGILFKRSSSGRPALFCRDPDGNALEFTQGC